MNTGWWFANDFHSWKLLANRLTRDPKIVIHGNSCIILYRMLGSSKIEAIAEWHLSMATRAGVKYVLSNTNTNTNTFFSGVSNTNTNTNTPAKIWSNTNTNTNTAHQIQIQIQIHNEAETKLRPFYRWNIKIYCIVRRLFYLFKFHWKLFPKVQSTISLHCFS